MIKTDIAVFAIHEYIGAVNTRWEQKRFNLKDKAAKKKGTCRVKIYSQTHSAYISENVLIPPE